MVLYSFMMLGQSVKLNEAGRIITQKKNTVIPEYKYENNKFVIEYDNLKLQGNGFYSIENGFLTVEGFEEAVPVILRFYDQQGIQIYSYEFNRVYNIRFSPEKNYIIFFDSKELIVMNTNDFKIKNFPSSPVFTVDNYGIPLFYDEKMNQLNYGNKIIHFEEQPIEFIFFKEKTFIFTRKNVYQLDDNNLKSLHSFDGSFFEAGLIDNTLFVVEKFTQQENFIFKLYNYDEKNIFNLIEEKFHQRNLSLRHEEIPSPIKYGLAFPHPVGNSYGEIQQYGSVPYLHPGVDIFGDHFEEVYAIKNGVVKAILTTSGSLHWRIAIANEQSTDTTEGYLYAHLVESSIPFAIGDTVEAGDIVGTLVPWPVADFTHIHFARIKAAGSIWNGAWWTTNNPHIDITGIIDTIPPVFENALGNNLFAFRDSNGIYLLTDQIKGKVQIISKVHDIANSNWKIDVYKLNYKLFEEGAPFSPLVDNISFTYDFKLDTYFSSNYEGMILNTIYSRDETCFSIGNYSVRDYYQIITNTDGSAGINPGDKNRLLDTRLLPSGVYSIVVTAKDASMNETTEAMDFVIDNPSPLKPLLSFPVNNSSGQPLMLDLQWQGSPQAESYFLQVAKDDLFEAMVINESNLSATNFTLDTLLPGTTYYWRVSSKGENGSSSFTDIWSFTTTGTVNIDETVNNTPNEFSLFQNYPNPFNPLTHISFSIPVTSNVKLVIYDLLGNEIITLVNELKSPGIYKVKFDAAEFSSGIYFYILNAGNFIETKKMVLIR